MAGYYDRDRRPRNAVGAPQSWDTQTPAGSMNHPYTHHGNVAEYQASGIPFALTINLDGTSTPEKISFPYVTQWFQVICNDNGKVIYLSFSADGHYDHADDSGTADPAPNNYIEIHTPAVITGTGKGHNPQMRETPCYRLKCKEIYLSADGACGVSIIAGLTSVKAADFPSISGLDGVG